MRIVYIIKSKSSGKRYIGSTNDVARRLREHNRGHTSSTRGSGDWRVIHREEYTSSIDAVRRERIIKSYKGGNALKKLLNNTRV